MRGRVAGVQAPKRGVERNGMESRIWCKAEEKWAYILVLRDHEVHRLKVTGNMLTMKKNLRAVLEALESGAAPADAGAKSVETLDARTIAKAEVAPGNGSLTLHGEGEGGVATKLGYSTGDSDADAILQAILERSGKTFQTTQEEIGVVEAVIPPVIVGAIGGLLWMGVYQTAGQIAAGEHVEVDGVRRRGMKRLLIQVSEILGVNGSIAVGVVLLILILGWTAMRIIHRPERTILAPATA